MKGNAQTEAWITQHAFHYKVPAGPQRLEISIISSFWTCFDLNKEPEDSMSVSGGRHLAPFSDTCACVCFVSTSLVQAELRTVIQTHVGVTQQAAGRLP